MVIYSTSALGVFQQSFLIVGGFLIAGVIGFVVALLRRMHKSKSWLGLAISCVFLAGIGIVVLGVTIKEMSTSTQTISARLDTKRVVQQSCDNPGPCNNDFVLSMTLAPKTYDFTVPQQAYDSTQEGLCYQVTYYPSNGLFGANTGSDLYVSSSYITNIIRMDQNGCLQ